MLGCSARGEEGGAGDEGRMTYRLKGGWINTHGSHWAVRERRRRATPRYVLTGKRKGQLHAKDDRRRREAGTEMKTGPDQSPWTRHSSETPHLELITDPRLKAQFMSLNTLRYVITSLFLASISLYILLLFLSARLACTECSHYPM